jgi:hypothetical protein
MTESNMLGRTPCCWTRPAAISYLTSVRYDKSAPL